MTSRRFGRVVLGAAMALGILAVGGNASATTITFEGHIPTNDGLVLENQDGFQFDFTAQGWGIFEDSFVGGGAPWTSDGTTRLVASGGLPNVTMTSLSATPFSLFGFDAATMFPDFATGQINVTGHLNGGGSISQLINLTNTFTPYALAGFVGLDSVDFTETIGGNFRADPGFSLDNLDLTGGSAAVPEPATLLLLGTGLAGVVRSRRRG